MNAETLNILFNFLPEITLAVFILILNIVNSAKRKSPAPYYICVTGILLAFIFTLMQAYYAPQLLFAGAFTADHFAYSARLIIMSMMLFQAIALSDKKLPGVDHSLSLLSASGALLAVQASNIFVLFVTLMVMAIPLYLLYTSNSKQIRKYYIIASVFAAVLLYGGTLLYGISGSGDYILISQYISANPYNTLILILAMVMIVIPLAFFSELAPVNLSYPLLAEKLNNNFVYQFSAVNVIAILFIIARFIFTVLHDSNLFIEGTLEISFIQSVNWKLLLSVISACSMVFGSFVILWQYDLKKIFTFITISQSGYLLAGLISASHEGLSSIIFGAIVLAVNSAGLMFTISQIELHYKVTDTTSIKGLGSGNKLLFASFVYFLVSSAGFPLTAGFNSKLLLYSLPGLQDHLWLIITGIISQTVFLYFIFRLTINIFSRTKTANTAQISGLPLIILLILLISAILPSILIRPFTNWAGYCSKLFGI